MGAADVAVIVRATGLLGFFGWFFFGPKTARRAVLRDGVQQIEVTVCGGYSPDVVRVRQGVPVRLTFDRRKSGECTSQVVFPDFGVPVALPAHGRAAGRAGSGPFG